jgi:1-acyl-sn-glycerol-3-phosphate acyltransferase
MEMSVQSEGASALKWLGGGDEAQVGVSPSELDPAFILSAWKKIARFFGPGKYFDVKVDGWENVPDDSALWVSNHSGGTVIPDVWGFGYAWIERFGTNRPIHPLAHDMIFAVPQVGRTFGKMGVLRASSQRALNTLREWERDVMVMPGGDVDVWRPHRDRYKLNFAGRKGYARLALKAGRPIVPVANAGAHDTLYVLTDGKRIARRLHFADLFRANIFPVSLSFPWGLAIGPVPHIPPPSKLRYKIGKAIPTDRYWVGREDIPEEVVTALDEKVQAAVQGLLNELEAEEPSLSNKVVHIRRTVGSMVRSGLHRSRRRRDEWLAAS